MPSPDLGFDELISPLTPAEFFAGYWEQHLYYASGRDPDRYQGLIGLSDVDGLVASLSSADGGWLSLVKGRASLPGLHFLNSEGLLKLSEVYAAYDQGCSILLTKVHRRHAAVGSLCRRLEASLTHHGVLLSKRIGANLYLTPRRAQGFVPHYDDHDVLVLQLEGTKEWHIYGRYVEFPLSVPREPAAEGTFGVPSQVIHCTPGDLLYLPRGFVHEARTGGSHSLHLTLSLFAATWLALLSRAMAADPRFRRGLPVGLFKGGRLAEGAARRFAEQVSLLASQPDLECHFRGLEEEFLERLDPIPARGFEQINLAVSIGPESRVRLRPDVFFRVVVSGRDLTIHLPGASFRAPCAMEPVFAFIGKAEILRVRDLPDLLSADAKIDLVRRLVREGFMEIC